MGLKEGDTAIIYMPIVLQSVACMLSCARLGITHSVVFGGFSSKELASRIIDCKAKVILTSSCGLEPQKIVDFPTIVRDAIKIAKREDMNIVYFDRKQKPLNEKLENEYFY